MIFVATCSHLYHLVFKDKQENIVFLKKEDLLASKLTSGLTESQFKKKTFSKKHRVPMFEWYSATQMSLGLWFPGSVKTLQPHLNNKNQLIRNFHYSPKFYKLSDDFTLKLSADDTMQVMYYRKPNNSVKFYCHKITFSNL